MTSSVILINKITRERKIIKKGWSWSLFLFSPLVLPLLFRDLYLWGSIFFMLSTTNVLCIKTLYSPLMSPMIYNILMFSIPASIISQIFLGTKGNQMLIKYYLQDYWEIEEYGGS